jgi:hypothetical protein
MGGARLSSIEFVHRPMPISSNNWTKTTTSRSTSQAAPLARRVLGRQLSVDEHGPAAASDARGQQRDGGDEQGDGGRHEGALSERGAAQVPVDDHADNDGGQRLARRDRKRHRRVQRIARREVERVPAAAAAAAAAAAEWCY